VSTRAAVAGGKVYIDPVKKECTAFAPATVANLGPGFDWLGCAVEVRMRLAWALRRRFLFRK
jgi:homoserine kinase